MVVVVAVVVVVLLLLIGDNTGSSFTLALGMACTPGAELAVNPLGTGIQPASTRHPPGIHPASTDPGCRSYIRSQWHFGSHTMSGEDVDWIESPQSSPPTSASSEAMSGGNLARRPPSSSNASHIQHVELRPQLAARRWIPDLDPEHDRTRPVLANLFHTPLSGFRYTGHLEGDMVSLKALDFEATHETIAQQCFIQFVEAKAKLATLKEEIGTRSFPETMLSTEQGRPDTRNWKRKRVEMDSLRRPMDSLRIAHTNQFADIDGLAKLYQDQMRAWGENKEAVVLAPNGMESFSNRPQVPSQVHCDTGRFP